MYDPILVNGIKDYEKKIEDYAAWIVKGGLRFQKGWALTINCPITCPDIARACTKEAYKQGARDVTVIWSDPYCDRNKFQSSSEKYLENTNPWPDLARKKYKNKDMAFIIIYSNASGFLKNLSMERQLKNSAWISSEFGSFKRGVEIPYVITVASNREWAKVVYPDLSEDQAYIKLWENLFEIAHVDGKSDPVKTWLKRCEEMQSNADKLNKFHFEKLHFYSGIGTNVEVKLPKTHKWMATAVNQTNKGLNFSDNLPTEEVYCVPEKTGVNGKFVSDRIMVTKSGLVKKPILELKDGKIIKFSAEKGEDVLKAIINSHKNGRFLGEIALVPHETPISLSQISYFNILLDENSGCHTAIGNAYTRCIEGGLQMSEKEIEAAGLNICSFHEDCVFGTKDMDIIGTTYSGEKIQVFKNGAFII